MSSTAVTSAFGAGSDRDSLSSSMECESVEGTIDLGPGEETDFAHLDRLTCAITSKSPTTTKAAVEILRCSRLIDGANEFVAAALAREEAAVASTATAPPCLKHGIAAREYLDCAAYDVKQLLALNVAAKQQGDATLLDSGITIADAAAVLTASMAECAKKADYLMPPAELCEWERGLLGPRADDELVRLTGVCLPTPPAAGDASRRDALVAAALAVIPKRHG